MNEKAENSRANYADALEFAMPIYLSIAHFELMEIFDWMAHGTVPGDILAEKGEQWLRSACGQLEAVGELAEAWLQMDTQPLLMQPIDGLDDLCLSVYASILQDRDFSQDSSNSSQLEREKMCAAYRLLMDNPQGTVLLDYSWLYGDIIEYRMVADDEAYWHAQNVALAFELKYGSADQIRERLICRVYDEITEGDFERGVRWFALLIENWPDTFEVYESGAAALFKAGQKRLANEVLYRAQHLKMDGEIRHFYEDLCFMYDVKPQKLRPESQLEKRMVRALSQPLPKSERLNAAAMLESLFPNIKTLPVKQICPQPGISTS
ncbi:MAG: hypothetical protein JXX14_04115 [Deltaproteobacteria bacterium]|nr:hypothetical protein [Deltaproteobacteria bacterium]